MTPKMPQLLLLVSGFSLATSFAQIPSIPDDLLTDLGVTNIESSQPFPHLDFSGTDVVWTGSSFKMMPTSGTTTAGNPRIYYNMAFTGSHDYYALISKGGVNLTQPELHPLAPRLLQLPQPGQ